MRGFALAYVALAAVYLSPLFVTPFLPAFDLPYHLALVDALTKAADPASPYASDFVMEWKLAPFGLHYVLLCALAEIAPLDIAAKLLVAMFVLGLPLATARLLAVSGREPMYALPAFALAYSMPLHYGLIGFVCALPFLVWMLAETLNENGWRMRPLRSALSVGVLSLATFFAHLEAWAVGIVGAMAAIVLGAIPLRSRRFALACLAPSVLLCLAFLIATGNDPRFSAEPSFPRSVLTERARELAHSGVINDLWSRVRGLPVHLLRGFHDGSDVVAARLFFGALALTALVRGARWARAAGRPAVRFTPAAAFVGVAAIAYFGLPHHLPHANSIYPRFDVVLGLMLLLVVPPRRAPAVAGAVLVLALSIYGVIIARHYAAFGRELADFERVLDASPRAVRSGGLVFDAESRVMNVEGVFAGMPAYYVARRAAPRSFTWLYYCEDPQVPCRRRDPRRVPPLPHFSYPHQLDPRRALEDVDLLFVRGGPPADAIFGNQVTRVRLLAAQGQWRVFARRSSARALDDQVRIRDAQQVLPHRRSDVGEHLAEQP